MKTINLTTTFLLIFVILSAHARQKQQSSAVSNKVYIKITKDVPQPPYLELADYSFTDSDGNKKIDAGEEVYIHFTLKNTGKGTGKGLKLSVKELNGIAGLHFQGNSQLQDIGPGGKQEIDIPVTGLMDLKNGMALFEVTVTEANGFGADKLDVEIETQAFREPKVTVADYQVSSQNATTLEKRKPFDLEILLQNLGYGTAKDVSVKVNFPPNVFCLTANNDQLIGEMKPNERKILSYQFVTNNEFSGTNILFEFIPSEKYGRYSEPETISLTMNQKVSGDKLIVRGTAEPEVKIELASLSSDVDRDIPLNAEKNPYKIALIIGNEDYGTSANAEINVKYARRDAEIFREYAVKTLGIEDRNIRLLINGTSGAMNRETDLISQLAKRLGSNSELIFYYAGHGFPDDSSKASYLIPVDVNASNLRSAIPLRDVYRKFGETGAKKITVILDACFSGGGRTEGILAARSVRIKPKEDAVMGNMVIFAAASGEQSSLAYDEQKHGMFTYFLLKKLQATKGTVNYGELSEYLKNIVGIESVRINGMPQDPKVTVSPDVLNEWESFTF